MTYQQKLAVARIIHENIQILYPDIADPPVNPFEYMMTWIRVHMAAASVGMIPLEYLDMEFWAFIRGIMVEFWKAETWFRVVIEAHLNGIELPLTEFDFIIMKIIEREQRLYYNYYAYIHRNQNGT